jgi:hypothetical protein
MGPVVGICEHTDERSGYIKGGEFLDQPSGYGLLNKHSAPWCQLSSQ